MLEIEHQHRLALELRIHGDEIARTIHAAAMMAAAGDEQQRAFGLMLGLREMSRQRDQNGEAITVVAGGVEPPIRVRVDDHHLIVSLPAHGANRVVAVQARKHFGDEIDPDTGRGVAGLGALQHARQEAAIVCAQVETRHPAIAEIADVHVARLLDHVQDRDGAALGQFARARGSARSLGIRAGCRMQRLDRNLALDADVRQSSIGRSAYQYERCRQRTLREL